MRLKDILIFLTIIQACIFLYYVPNTVEYLYNNVTNGISNFNSITQSFRTLIGIGVNLIGIVAIVLYFVQKNNVHNRLLKAYLIYHTFSILAFLPSRLMWILDPPTESYNTPWYNHLFLLLSLSLAVVAILVYSRQKTRVLPAPISSKSVRFLHYIIDIIYVNFTALNAVSIFLVRADFYDFSLGHSSDVPYYLIAVVVAMFLPLLYYTLCEAGFQQTLGKVLTGAYVRSSNGQKASFISILGRSLCRFIPFEPFSFLGDPGSKWHDKFSGTDVFYKSNVDFEQGDEIMEHLIEHNKPG